MYKNVEKAIDNMNEISLQSLDNILNNSIEEIDNQFPALVKRTRKHNTTVKLRFFISEEDDQGFVSINQTCAVFYIDKLSIVSNFLNHIKTLHVSGNQKYILFNDILIKFNVLLNKLAALTKHFDIPKELTDLLNAHLKAIIELQRDCFPDDCPRNPSEGLLSCSIS